MTVAGDRDLLAWLESFYAAECDGTWEHDHGVKIDTLDNPGWRVEADVGPSVGAHSDNVERSELDWISYAASDGKFVGYGGPQNLRELLEVLRKLVVGRGRP
jgi:hypothetical protein